MISSFVSGHGHRGLLRREERRRGLAASLATATPEEEYGASRTCSRKATEVLQSARSKDADGSGLEKDGMI
jgi:hypothetical protein